MPQRYPPHRTGMAYPIELPVSYQVEGREAVCAIRCTDSIDARMAGRAAGRDTTESLDAGGDQGIRIPRHHGPGTSPRVPDPQGAGGNR